MALPVSRSWAGAELRQLRAQEQPLPRGPGNVAFVLGAQGIPSSML